MANLQSLKPSITSLPLHAQMDIHEAIRISRMVTKQPKTKAAAKRKTEKKAGINALNSLSLQQAQALLDKLKAEGRI